MKSKNMEIPDEIIKAEQTLSSWMKKNNIQKFGGLTDRRIPETEYQWLLKVSWRLVKAGCESDGILDSLDELIKSRDDLQKELESWKKCAEDMARDLESLGFDKYHPYVIDFTKLKENHG